MTLHRRTLSLLACLSLGSAGALRLELPAQLGAKSGDFLTVPVRIVAEGGEALPEGVEFAAGTPEGWDVLSGGDLALSGGALAVSFFVPEAALAGRYALPITFTTATGQQLRGQVAVDVAPLSGVALDLPRADAVGAGETRTYALVVTNTGNHPDTIRLSAEGDATLQRDRVTLAPGERATVQVRYQKTGQGNQATVRVTGVSLSDPEARAERDLMIAVRPVGFVAGADGPQLFYGLRLSGEYLRRDDANSFGVGVEASLAGALSDSVNVFAQYQRVAFGDAGPLGQDLALLLLQGPNWDLRGAATQQLSNAALDGDYVNGDLRFGVGVSRNTRDAVPFFGVRGRVEERAGWRASYEHRFVAGGEDDLRVGWQRRFENVEPSVDVYATRQDGQWAFGVRQALQYENQSFLAAQRYDYNASSGTHDFTVSAAMRRTEPFSLGGAFSATLQPGGTLTYNAAGRLGYRWSPDLSATLTSSVGSLGFGVGLDTLYTLHLLPGDLDLSASVGYQNGFTFGAGADFATGRWGLSAAVSGDATGLRKLGAQAVYGDAFGLQLSGSADWQRPLGGAWQSSYGAGLGYAADAWQAGLTYRLTTAGGQVTSGVGASASARVTPNLNVGASATYAPGRTTLRVGASYDFAGGFLTPTPIVNAFGGRNVGTLDITAFLDANQNGVRDADEGPASGVELSAGGTLGKTDANGKLRLELRPQQYSVALGPNVTASYATGPVSSAQVFAKTATTLEVPILEVGTVQGRLLADGQPIGGAAVTVRSGDVEKTATTDASGFYRLGGLSFGAYTLSVQLDPALLEAPAPVGVTLSRDHALLNQDLAAKRVAAQAVVYNAADLTLDLALPDADVPPGASVPVSVTTNRAAQGVTLDGPSGRATLESADGRTWTGRLNVPKDAKSGFEVFAHAQIGEAHASERGFLSVDPSLPSAQLLLTPGYALPGQVLDATVLYYGAGTQLELRDAAGGVTLLTPGQGRTYTADLRAPAQSGQYVLKLFVDGEPLQEVSFTVLGRP